MKNKNTNYNHSFLDSVRCCSFGRLDIQRIVSIVGKGQGAILSVEPGLKVIGAGGPWGERKSQ
jgi:hypothetical protein